MPNFKKVMPRMLRNNWTCAGLSLLLMAGLVQADDATAQKAMAKAQFMLRQATTEKTALQQQVIDLQKQVDTLTKQLGNVKASSSAKQESLAQQMSGNSEKWREANEKVSEDLKTTREKLKTSTQKSVELEQNLKSQTDNFSLCYANNKKLYDINKELLSKYKDKGAMDALLQKEPFTGVSQVEVENLIQDYQYKLDDLKLPTSNLVPDAKTLTTEDVSSQPGGKAANTP
jgi:chromosome segregation ATPase